MARQALTASLQNMTRPSLSDFERALVLRLLAVKWTRNSDHILLSAAALLRSWPTAASRSPQSSRFR
jgi:hypothetical protein